MGAARRMLLAAALLAGCAGPAPLDPEAVRARVRAEGPQAVVADLYGDGNRAPGWLALLRGVASGEPAWIGTGMALAPGTGAGAATELRNSFFLALEPGPEAVLVAIRRAPGLFGIESVCGADVTTDVDADRALSLVMARLGTVRDVAAVELSAERDRCLRALERGMNAYR
jgi:hypothetical protein